MTPDRRIAAVSFIGLALCVAAYHATRKPKAPEPEPAPALAAPEPVEALAGRALDEEPAAPPRYTNEQLHAMLQRQRQELGITAVGKDADAQQEQQGGFIEPGQPGNRENVEAYIRQLAAMRKAIQGGKPRNVAIDGQTAPVLSNGERGRPLEPEEARPSAPSIESNAVVRHADGSWSGSFGGPELGERVIADAELWKAFWSHISRDPAPEVDFAKEMVAVVFLGLRPTGGYQARITGHTLGRTDLVVTYTETPPAPGRTPPQERTAPFALRLIPKTSKPVRFQKAGP